MSRLIALSDRAFTQHQAKAAARGQPPEQLLEELIDLAAPRPRYATLEQFYREYNGMSDGEVAEALRRQREWDLAHPDGARDDLENANAAHTDISPD